LEPDVEAADDDDPEADPDAVDLEEDAELAEPLELDVEEADDDDPEAEPDAVDLEEDAELAELLELDVEATDDDEPEAEPDAEDFDDIAAEPDAPPALPELVSHLPVAGFGDVPAGPFFAQ
jgi:hypothetical protein